MHVVRVVFRQRCGTFFENGTLVEKLLENFERNEYFNHEIRYIYVYTRWTRSVFHRVSLSTAFVPVAA